MTQKLLIRGKGVSQYLELLGGVLQLNLGALRLRVGVQQILSSQTRTKCE
jgi:hypothetical protein